MNSISCSPFGSTRSRVTGNYALIVPDTHVSTAPNGWTNASAVVHISPELGARFLQYTAVMQSHAASASPGAGIERFVFVLDGSVQLTVADVVHSLHQDEFAFLPANAEHTFTTGAAARPARIEVFEKPYRPSAGAGEPNVRIGKVDDVPGKAFLGDDALQLQVLLPDEPAFDLAVNVFTYQPGGTLPQVEIHVMEHGLLMLSGAGVYRLGDDYFPVQAGDVIWMASYCPQWFVAMGKTPAKYLYYKDVHRDRWTER